MKKLVCIILLASVTAGVIIGCSSKSPQETTVKADTATPDSLLLGGWVEPINGMPGKYQGIRIEKEGKASSINMATLVYKSWKLAGDTLLLDLESIGNGQTILATDTLTIKKLSADSLVLDSKYGYVVKYTREK